MILKANIPKLTAHPRGFPGFWLTLMMSETFDRPYTSKAIVANYVRHVDAAYASYRNGRVSALRFINNKRGVVPVFEFLASSSHFEHCIGNTHRAIQCMRGIIRNKAVPGEIKGLFSPRPRFVRADPALLIKNIRDAVQHTYEQISEDKITEDSAFVLAVTGLEKPFDDKAVPNQVLKTFDRLNIGSLDLLLQDLVNILEEMGDCAERLAGYAPTRT